MKNKIKIFIQNFGVLVILWVFAIVYWNLISKL